MCTEGTEVVEAIQLASQLIRVTANGGKKRFEVQQQGEATSLLLQR